MLLRKVISYGWGKKGLPSVYTTEVTMKYKWVDSNLLLRNHMRNIILINDSSGVYLSTLTTRERPYTTDLFGNTVTFCKPDIME